MKVRNNYLLILPLTLMFSMFATAIEANSVDISNPGKITGRINHENTNQPLEFVNVALYSATDSTLFAGTLTNQSGEFAFSMIDSGYYYIELTLPGYQNRELKSLYVSTVGDKINMGEILLSPVTKENTTSRVEREKHTKKRKVKNATIECPKPTVENEMILVDNNLKAEMKIGK